MSDFLLYGNRESGHSYKIKLMLSVARVTHRYEEIDLMLPREQRPELFRSRSAYGEVPVLMHGEQALVQSDAILLYLADYLQAYGGESPARLTRAREWLFWEANRIGFSFPHIRFARKFAPQDYAPDVLTWLEQRFALDVARLDNELSDGRRFILDDLPSIADFALCGYLFWSEQGGVELPAYVSNWLDQIRSLPGWQAPYDLMRN